MRCTICARQPRSFALFGGDYWRHLFGEHLCPICHFWAYYQVGVRED